MNKIKIVLRAGEDDRLPISNKVLTYIEDIVLQEVLIKKNILVNTKWFVRLNMMIMETGHNIPDKVQVFAPTIVTSENTKSYPVIIPVKFIKAADEPREKLIELIFEGVKVFFTINYKSITEKFMDDLFQQTERDYLFGLPYPAPPRELNGVYS